MIEPTAAIALYHWLRGAAYAEIHEVRTRSGVDQLPALQVVALQCEVDAWLAFVVELRAICIPVTVLDRSFLTRHALVRDRP